LRQCASRLIDSYLTPHPILPTVNAVSLYLQHPSNSLDSWRIWVLNLAKFYHQLILTIDSCFCFCWAVPFILKYERLLPRLTRPYRAVPLGLSLTGLFPVSTPLERAVPVQATGTVPLQITGLIPGPAVCFATLLSCYRTSTHEPLHFNPQVTEGRSVSITVSSTYNVNHDCCKLGFHPRSFRYRSPPPLEEPLRLHVALALPSNEPA
jgi:hypothetical protein